MYRYHNARCNDKNYKIKVKVRQEVNPLKSSAKYIKRFLSLPTVFMCET